jgi:hypothetical protein
MAPGRMAPGMVKPHEPVLVASGLINVSDHDSRPMRTHGDKPLQGYNAQLAVNERQVVIAAELTTDSPDFGHLEPMVRAARRELRGVELGDPGVVVADAGYWHRRQIETVVGDGIQVLVAPDSSLRRGARPGWTGGLYDFMRRVLATPDGRALYRQRQATIEPVFGQLKFNRQIRRFQRRGRAACRSQWRLITATHNLLKLHRHRIAAVPAEQDGGPCHSRGAGPRPRPLVAPAALPRGITRQPHAKAAPHPNVAAPGSIVHPPDPGERQQEPAEKPVCGARCRAVRRAAASALPMTAVPIATTASGAGCSVSGSTAARISRPGRRRPN